MKSAPWIFLLLMTSSPLMADTPPRGINLVAVIGNSQAVGWAAFRGAPKIRNTDRIWNYKLNGTWDNPARDPLHDPAGALYPILSNANPKVGPGMYFAEQYTQEHPGENIGLIPCARNGSSITDWQPSDNADTLYGACIARLLSAKRHGKLIGILVEQGAADAWSPGDAARWPQKFKHVIRSLRFRLSDSRLPIVFAQIGTICGDQIERYPYWRNMYRQQARVRMPGVAMIKTRDLTTLDDCMHRDAISNKIAGGRYESALAKLRGEQR